MNILKGIFKGVLAGLFLCIVLAFILLKTAQAGFLGEENVVLAKILEEETISKLHLEAGKELLDEGVEIANEKLGYERWLKKVLYRMKQRMHGRMLTLLRIQSLE